MWGAVAPPNFSKFVSINLHFAPFNNVIDLFKGYKKFIDLKSEINLTSSTTKFTNNKLKPKQHPEINPHKTQTKNKIKNS